MDNQEEHKDIHKSQAGKLAWKRHHNNFMRGARERERNYMNKSFYGIAKDLEEALTSNINEEIIKDNIFNLESLLSFKTISGAISLNINETNGDVSISTSLDESGKGSYRLRNNDNEDQESYQILYQNIQEDLENIVDNFDNEVKQILMKYGLSET